MSSPPPVAPRGALFNTLDAMGERHQQTMQDDVGRLILQAGTRYREELEAYLGQFRHDRALWPVLEPMVDEIREYMVWLRWLGWNIGVLGPVVYGPSPVAVDALGLGLLGYAAGRLVDDGIDDHDSYKGRHRSLVGALRARWPEAPPHQACVQSVYIGFSLFHFTLRRMHQSGHADWADQACRMFDALSVGVLAETLLVPPVQPDVYRRVIRRKSVAYNLILYKTFLASADPRLRSRLLPILADMDELAQLVNDYVDLEDDAIAGTLNAVTFGVCSPAELERFIIAGAESAWRSAGVLAEPIREALAVMLRSVVQPYRDAVARRGSGPFRTRD